MVLLFTIVLPSTGAFERLSTRHVVEPQSVEGRVVGLISQHSQATPDGPEEVQQFTVLLESGPSAGRAVLVTHDYARNRTFQEEAGDRVLVGRGGGTVPGTGNDYIADFDCGAALWRLAVLFVALVLVVADFTGLRALAGMGVSIAIILRFVLPGIIPGLCGSLALRARSACAATPADRRAHQRGVYRR